jgi:hypothetical protein
MSADEDLGLVYLPVEDPTGDYYGGHRPGNNLFGDSIVCLDLTTGKRKWHYQVIHHPIWNYDSSAEPILADINVNGKAIQAVVLPGKQAFLYVFDRVTGQPVWPIDEKPVQQSDVPYEKTSPTQPFPTKPPAYSRNVLHVPDDLIDFTPELRAQAKDILARYRVAGLFNPSLIGNPNGLAGFDQHRQRCWRHKLERRRLRPRNARRLRPGRQRRAGCKLTAHVSGGFFGHALPRWKAGSAICGCGGGRGKHGRRRPRR